MRPTNSVSRVPTATEISPRWAARRCAPPSVGNHLQSVTTFSPGELQSPSATGTSISTAPSRGNAATPTADRVWRPASPKTSANPLLAPSMTAGCSWKAGAEDTKPVTVSTREMRSSEPSAASSTASALRAHTAAAWLPCSTVTSSPRRPRQVSFPSMRGSWPEVRATPSWMTTASRGSCGGCGPYRVRPSSASRAAILPSLMWPDLSHVGVHAGETLVDLLGQRVDGAELLGSPDDLGAALDQGRVVHGLRHGGGHGHHAVVGDQRSATVLQRLDRLLSQIGRAAGGVLGAADVAAQVDGELVDAARDVLMGHGEHGGVDGVGVDDHRDVVVGGQAGQVQVLLRRGGLGAGHGLALGVDDDDVLELHDPVVQRGGVQATLPSSIRAEMLPEVPSTRPFS